MKIFEDVYLKADKLVFKVKYCEKDFQSIIKVGKDLKVKDIYTSIPKKIDVNKNSFNIFGKINENEAQIKLDLEMPLYVIKDK